jgi:hypothetical protein
VSGLELPRIRQIDVAIASIRELSQEVKEVGEEENRLIFSFISPTSCDYQSAAFSR